MTAPSSARRGEGATELLITADAGGNRGRSRAFQVELQKFTDRTG